MTDIPLPRVTVAAVVRKDGRYLLVEEESRGQRRLNQPAGHLDPGESIVDAVVRETLEETGAHIVPQALVGIYQWQAPHNGRRVVRFAFATQLVSHDDSAPLDEGIVRSHWLSREELEASPIPHRSPLVMRNIDDYEAGVRYPLDLLSAIPPL